MKNFFYLVFSLAAFASCGTNKTADNLIEFVQESYSESSSYFIYGSVVRAVVNIASTNVESVEALQDLEKITYFNISTDHSKNTYHELLDKSKSLGLEEYVTIEKGALKSLPSELQSFTEGALQIHVLVKDHEGVANNIVVVMRKKESVVFLVSDGDLEIKKLMNIKFDNTEEIEKSIKNFSNIF